MKFLQKKGMFIVACISFSDTHQPDVYVAKEGWPTDISLAKRFTNIRCANKAVNKLISGYSGCSPDKHFKVINIYGDSPYQIRIME